MPGTACASQDGYCDHILNLGNACSVVFHKEHDHAAFLKLLVEANEHLPMRVIADCPMPNHLRSPKPNGAIFAYASAGIALEATRRGLMKYVPLCFCVLLSVAPRYVVSADKKQTPGQKLIDQYHVTEQKLVLVLKDPKLWNEAARQRRPQTHKPREAELLGYLDAAGALRSIAAIPILVRQIGYSPYYGVPTGKIVPTHIRYPCYGALRKIGLPAIAGLLDHLKSSDPLSVKEHRNPDIPESRKMQNRLSWRCIAYIYAEGKSVRPGVPFALSRIRAEIAAIQKEGGRVNLVAVKRLQRVITDMKEFEEFLKKP